MFKLPEHYAYTVNGITRAEWSAAMAGFADATLYQSWEYGSVRWGEKNLGHIILTRDGTPVAAAQLRLIRIPLLQTGCAYITWGPLWKPKGQKPESDNLLLLIDLIIEEYCNRRKFAYLIVSTHGFESIDDETARVLTRRGMRPSKAFFARKRRTILIDLHYTPDEMRARMEKGWRRNLKGAEKEGLTIQESFDGSFFGRFIEIYDDLKKQKGFEGVNVEEFRAMQAMLPDGQKLRLSLCFHDNVPVAGSVCSIIGETVMGILGATSLEGRKYKAYYLLQWDEMLWAKKAGGICYDLDGINPEKNPNVYHFKSGLNGREVTFLPVYTYSKSRMIALLVAVAESMLIAVRRVRPHIENLRQRLRSAPKQVEEG